MIIQLPSHTLTNEKQGHRATMGLRYLRLFRAGPEKKSIKLMKNTRNPLARTYIGKISSYL